MAEGKDRRYFAMELIVTAARLTAARSDGAPFDLAALESLGTAYWDDWQARADAARQA